MSDAGFRFVDAHVHQWNAKEHPLWYPAMAQESPDPEHQAGLGDSVGGLPRLYLRDEYARDAAGYGVTKILHVAASTEPSAYLDEVRWIGDMVASGWPAAQLGTFDPSLPVDEIAAAIATEAQQPGFRGVRGWFGLDPATPKTPQIFALAADQDWLFDLVIHPGEAFAYAALIEAAGRTTFVLEHTGWPETVDADHRRQWKAGIERLAACPNLYCKLSGLPMVLQTVEAEPMRPYIDACLDAFGVDRCMFASNFPVDGLFGSFSALIDSYREITSHLGAADIEQLFATNAERIYRF